MSDPQQCKKHPKSQMLEAECDTCGGEGLKEWDDGYSFTVEMVPCWHCKGSGIDPWRICEECNWEEADNDYEIMRLPVGVDHAD